MSRARRSLLALVVAASASVACRTESVAYRLEVREAVMHVRELSPPAASEVESAATRTATSSAPVNPLPSGPTSFREVRDAPAPSSTRPPVSTLRRGDNAWRFSSDVGLDHTLSLAQGDLQWTLHNEGREVASIPWIEPYRVRLDLGAEGDLALPQTQRLFSASSSERYCGDGVEHPAPAIPSNGVEPGEDLQLRLQVPGRMRGGCSSSGARPLLPTRVRGFEVEVLERFVGQPVRVWLPARRGRQFTLLQVDLELAEVEVLDSGEGPVKKPWLRRSPWELGGFIGFGTQIGEALGLYGNGGLRLHRVLAVTEDVYLRAAYETSLESDGSSFDAWWNGLRLDLGVGDLRQRGTRGGVTANLSLGVSHGLVDIGCPSGGGCVPTGLRGDNVRLKTSIGFSMLWPGGVLSLGILGVGVPLGALSDLVDVQLELLSLSADFAL